MGLLRGNEENKGLIVLKPYDKVVRQRGGTIFGSRIQN